MDEMILFNQGNQLASSFDPKELERTVQVEQTRQARNNLIIVRDPATGEYILFDLADVQKDDQTAKSYQVEKKL